VEVYQINEVSDEVVEHLAKYIQTGSLPESADGEVRQKGNVVEYRRFDLHKTDKSKKRGYSVKESQVRVAEEKINEEFESRDL
jgi:hypothetical protein